MACETALTLANLAMSAMEEDILLHGTSRDPDSVPFVGILDQLMETEPARPTAETGSDRRAPA